MLNFDADVTVRCGDAEDSRDVTDGERILNIDVRVRIRMEEEDAGAVRIRLGSEGVGIDIESGAGAADAIFGGERNRTGGDIDRGIGR